jgi:hypothetical protein
MTKTVLFLLNISLFLAFCSNPSSHTATSKANSDTIPNNADSTLPVSEGSTIDTGLIKFEAKYSFNDFKFTSLFTAPKSPINYRSNVLAREYKTVITEGYKKDSMNFAGHYCIVNWRCGAPCQQFAVIDLKDGKVYDGLMTPLGFDFYPNSRMILVNPPNYEGYYDSSCVYCRPEIWVWDEKTKKFFEKN